MKNENPQRLYSYRDCLPLRYRQPLNHAELRTVKRPGDLELTPRGTHRHG